MKSGLTCSVLVVAIVSCLVLWGMSTPPSQASGGNASGPLGPLAAHLLPTGSRVQFEGHVVERVSAGSYTYLRVQEANGELRWVVTLGSAGIARLRAQVRIVAVGYAERFESKRLARSFDGLYFAVVRPA